MGGALVWRLSRRELLAIGTLVTASVVGCLDDGGDENSDQTDVLDDDTELREDESAEDDGEAVDEEEDDDSLPEEPGEEVDDEPGEFEPEDRDEPIAANRFTDAYQDAMENRDVLTGYWLSPDEEEAVLEVAYVADVDNQEDYLRHFAGAFLEVVHATGGTGWDMEFEVQVTGGEVWYYWEVHDEWAITYLSGEWSEEEFYDRVFETIEEPDE